MRPRRSFWETLKLILFSLLMLTVKKYHYCRKWNLLIFSVQKVRSLSILLAITHLTVIKTSFLFCLSVFQINWKRKKIKFNYFHDKRNVWNIYLLSWMVWLNVILWFFFPHLYIRCYSSKLLRRLWRNVTLLQVRWMLEMKGHWGESLVFFFATYCLSLNAAGQELVFCRWNLLSPPSATGQAFLSINEVWEFSRIFWTLPQHSRKAWSISIPLFIFTAGSHMLIYGHGVISFNRSKLAPTWCD